MNTKVCVLASVMSLGLFSFQKIEGYNFRGDKPHSRATMQQRSIDGRSSVQNQWDARSRSGQEWVDSFNVSGEDSQAVKINSEVDDYMPKDNAMLKGKRFKSSLQESSDNRLRYEKFGRKSVSGTRSVVRHPMKGDDVWRFEGSENSRDGIVAKLFRPEGSNQDLNVVPYRGEFYSRGGKPFTIDPGLIGRWR